MITITDEELASLSQIVDQLGYMIGRFTGRRLLEEETETKITILEDLMCGNEGGEKMPPKLKYGQGSLTKREIVRKNGTIYKYWEATYGGRSKTAKTKEAAYALLKDLRNQIPAQCTLTAPITPKIIVKAKQETVGEYLQYWYETYRKDDVGKKSREAYERYIKRVDESFENRKYWEATTDEIQEFLKTIDGTNTRNKVRNMLNSAFSLAFETGKVKLNPVAGTRVKHRSQERRPFHFDEQTNILANLSPEYASIYFFLCCTGLRIGEFLALNDIKLIRNKEGMIHIDHSADIMSGELGNTKTESSNRDVDYIPLLHTILNDRYVNIETVIGKYNYNQIYGALRRVCKKLEIKGICPHSTRHTFASVSRHVGIPDTVTQHRLGHATLTMTLNIYTHNLRGDESSPILTYFREYAKK